MDNILKTTTRMGHFILRNRNKVLIGVGTIALAGAVSGVLSYLKTRRQVSDTLTEKKTPQEKFINARNHGHKMEKYKAPAIASENLIKH